MLIIVGSTFLPVPYANACSCIPPAPPQESLKQAVAVFTGKVVSIKNPQGIFESSLDPIKVTFEIREIWKGVEGKTLSLTTAQSSASCGVSFEQGKDYIVYAHEGKEGLEASLCSRTTEIANASEDVEALGVGAQPTSTTDNAANTNSNTNQFPAVGYIGVVGALLLLGLGIWKYR